MSSVDEKKVVLGPEHDQELRTTLGEVLRTLGATSIQHAWGVAGPQEPEQVAVDIGGSPSASTSSVRRS